MNTWNTKEISIDFIEKVTKCNIEKKKKTYLILSIVFFTIAILTWIYIFFSMISMMFVFYMGSNSFVSFVLFAFGIVYLQSYRKTSIILRIINDIKRSDKRNINELCVLYGIPYNNVMSLAMFAISNNLLSEYEIVNNWVAKKSLHFNEKDDNTPISFIKCLNCGASLSSKEKECPYCGTKMR